MKKDKNEMEKRLAKTLTIHGYRNSPIEDIHAGRWPKDNKGNWAKPEDMFVSVDGGSKIPWLEMSRITDEEMKHINKTIHSQIYTILVLLKKGKLPGFYWWGGENWDEPELLEM